MSKTSKIFMLCAVFIIALMSSSMAAELYEEKGPGEPYKPLPKDKVVVTKVKHFGVVCWKIATAGGTFYYENGNETGGTTGFSSAFDSEGNDWIGADNELGYNKVPGCKGWGHKTRGFPKLTGYPEFDTPTQKTGAKTRWVDADGKDIEFVDKLEGEHLIMRTANDSHEVEYHFFPSHAVIKIIKMGGPYAFHFQGLIGGEPDESPKDHYVLIDGKKRNIQKNNWTMNATEYPDAKFPSPFLYLEDSDVKKTQVFYMGAKNLTPETYGDEAWYACCPDGSLNVAVFSFGRKSEHHSLTGTDAIFIFGFQPKAAGHKGISDYIVGRLADPFVPSKAK